MEIMRELERALEIKREEHQILQQLRELRGEFHQRFTRNSEFLMELLDVMPDAISINWEKVQRRLR